MGKSLINGLFSIAMFDYRIVTSMETPHFLGATSLANVFFHQVPIVRNLIAARYWEDTPPNHPLMDCAVFTRQLLGIPHGIGGNLQRPRGSAWI